MKKCVLIGTCQIGAVGKILSSSPKFLEQYNITKTILVHVISASAIEDFFTKIKDIDLLILQPISQNYRKGIISTKRIQESISSTCQTIMIPYLFFTGYFPSMSYIKNTYNKKVEKYNILYHDLNIIKHLVEKIDIDKAGGTNNYLKDTHNKKAHFLRIKNILNDKDYYSKRFILRHVNKTLKILELRERNPYDYGKPVDIKMSNYIRNNYQNQKLFHTMNHPTNILLLETTKRILSKLSIVEDILLSKKEYLGDMQFPIYPSISINLNLKFKTDITYIDKFTMNFNQFINLYINLYFKDIKIETLIHNYLL